MGDRYSLRINGRIEHAIIEGKAVQRAESILSPEEKDEIRWTLLVNLTAMNE